MSISTLPVYPVELEKRITSIATRLSQLPKDFASLSDLLKQVHVNDLASNELWRLIVEDGKKEIKEKEFDTEKRQKLLDALGELRKSREEVEYEINRINSDMGEQSKHNTILFTDIHEYMMKVERFTDDADNIRNLMLKQRASKLVGNVGYPTEIIIRESVDYNGLPILIRKKDREEILKYLQENYATEIKNKTKCIIANTDQPWAFNFKKQLETERGCSTLDWRLVREFFELRGADNLPDCMKPDTAIGQQLHSEWNVPTEFLRNQVKPADQ